MTFSVSSSGFKVCKHVVIGKSKVPRCFRKLPNHSKQYGMQYFHSKKVWKTTEIMVQVLTTLDRNLHVENQKGLPFLDNAPSHPKTLQRNLKNIKLVFLPKNNTSQLKPCDAGINRNFQVKYCKQLLKQVISRIDDGKKTSEIFQEVDLLQCMRWVNQAFEQITKDTIKHCFEKCGFSEVSLFVEEPDEEFEYLLKSLTIDVMSDDYVSFDDDVDTSEIPINVQKKDWEDILRKRYIEKVNADPDEINISSDESDWKTTIIFKLLKKKILRYHLLLHCRC